MPARVNRAGQIERVLTNIYLRFYGQIQKDHAFPYDMVSLKAKFNNAVYSTTRAAITESYQEGIKYVGSRLHADVYLGDTDLANIKEDTNKAVASFWGRIGNDAFRTREQEVEEEKKRADLETESFLGTIAGIGVTSALAVSTVSKSKQIASVAVEDKEDKPKITWRAQMDERTCQRLPSGEPGCASLDGQEWDFDDPEIPVPGRLGPNGTHPNCRCYLDLG